MAPESSEEYLNMCSYSGAVEAEAVRRTLADLVREGLLDLSVAARKADMTEEEFRRVMEIMENARALALART